MSLHFFGKIFKKCTHFVTSLLHTLNGCCKDFTTIPSIVKSPHYIIFCISMENFTAFSFTTQSFMTQHFSASDYFWGLIFRQIFLLWYIISFVEKGEKFSVENHPLTFRKLIVDISSCVPKRDRPNRMGHFCIKWWMPYCYIYTGVEIFW